MSSDYLLYLKPSKPGPYTLDDIGDTLAPIGTCEELKARIAGVFPATVWEASPHVPGAWFGLGVPDFQFTIEPDGMVVSFMASRVEAEQVLQLARALNLIALEIQQDVILA